MQEIERYNKELIEIERVSDYRYEENEQLKQENRQLKAQIERMKEDIEELKCSSFDAGMFNAVDGVLIKWKKNNIDEVEE